MRRQLRSDYGHHGPYAWEQVRATGRREGVSDWELVYLHALFSAAPPAGEGGQESTIDVPSPAELKAARGELAHLLFDGDLGFGPDDIDHVLTRNDSLWGFGDGGCGDADVGGEMGGGGDD